MSEPHSDTHRVLPESPCPTCGKQLNGAHMMSQGDDDCVPMVGDATVCWYCLAVNTFDETGRLAKPTKEQVAVWRNDPDTWNLIKKTRLLIKYCRRQEN